MFIQFYVIGERGILVYFKKKSIFEIKLYTYICRSQDQKGFNQED